MTKHQGVPAHKLWHVGKLKAHIFFILWPYFLYFIAICNRELMQITIPVCNLKHPDTLSFEQKPQIYKAY